MRCPDCNAHNADGATFCTLCLRSFEAAPPTPAIPPAPAAPPTPADPVGEHAPAGEPIPADGPAESDEALPARPVRATARSGRFRRTEEGFDWQCDRCAAWNPIELTTCRACARPFRTAMGEHDEDDLPEVDPTVAVVLSAVAPGSGHLLLDRVGAGAARLGLFTLWLLGALVFIAQSSGTGRFPWVALPLLLGAMALSGASVIDVQRLLRRSGDPVLDGSNLLWLVVTVFGVTILAMIPTLLEASGDVPAVEQVGDEADPPPGDGGLPGDGAPPDVDVEPSPAG